MLRTKSGLIVIAVIAGLFNIGMPHTKAAPQRLSLKSESQIKSEANLYDTAIREISRIETMKIATADDVKPVKAILERQIPNLRFSRSKAIAIGLADSTFINAAKARTSDNRTAEEFAKELAINDQVIYNLSGAQALKEKINRGVVADVATLRRVSEYLDRSSKQIKQAHHATLIDTNSREAPETNPQRNPAVEFFAATLVTSLLVSLVMIACPPFALALPLLASAAVSAVITAGMISGAAKLVGRVAANIGTEQGRDKVAECLEQVDRTYDNCVANNPLLAMTGGCLAQWLLQAAGCITAE